MMNFRKLFIAKGKRDEFIVVNYWLGERAIMNFIAKTATAALLWHFNDEQNFSLLQKPPWIFFHPLNLHKIYEHGNSWRNLNSLHLPFMMFLQQRFFLKYLNEQPVEITSSWEENWKARKLLPLSLVEFIKVVL